MLRKMNWIGACGLAMLIFGVTTFLGDGNGYLPLWVAWLIAPLFWYAGFFLTVWWIVALMVGTEQKAAPLPAQRNNVIVELQPKQTFSNFLEHDCDVASEGTKRVLPACGAMTIALALMLPAFSAIAVG
jgi:hypothetical protein